MDNLEAIKKDKTIKTDRLRFTKNSLPALLIYIAIILDVLYFIGIYKVNNEYFYKYFIGLSVLINLVFLLASFLCSEGIKNYKKNFSYVMIVLGIIQIARIFYYPLKAHQEPIYNEAEEITGYVMENPLFLKCIYYLVGSAVCLIVGAIIGYIRTVRLENYNKTLKQ